MRMTLRKVIVREQFSKDSQVFHLIIELEDKYTGIHRSRIDLEKGMDDVDAAKELLYLSYQVNK